MSDEINILYTKINTYFELHEPIHITFKDGHWHNGKIVKVEADFFLLDDFEDGLIDPVFYIELKDDGIRQFEPPVKSATEVKDDSL